jgi:hypothetical protein
MRWAVLAVRLSARSRLGCVNRIHELSKQGLVVCLNLRLTDSLLVLQRFDDWRQRI